VAEKWLQNIFTKTGKIFNYTETRKLYLSYLETTLKLSEKDYYEKNLNQIKKDLYRTFPSLKNFQRNITGTTDITQLKNILRAIVRRNTEFGYVQGMNFVLGSLFFHSSEVVAFWVFDILLNYYGVKELYGKNLAGLHLRTQVLDLLIESVFPDVWLRMVFSFIRY